MSTAGGSGALGASWRLQPVSAAAIAAAAIAMDNDVCTLLLQLERSNGNGLAGTPAAVGDYDGSLITRLFFPEQHRQCVNSAYSGCRGNCKQRLRLLGEGAPECPNEHGSRRPYPRRREAGQLGVEAIS